MIKNKDDEFFGDAITSNVQYYDNEWQAQGTVDRGSMFTKEPLLQLLFAGKDYDNRVNDYTRYVPRTTQSAAKLTHDLMVLDNYFYIASSTASSINIFDIVNFVQKSFAIANPIYDKNARKSSISLIDYKKIGDMTVMDLLSKVAKLFIKSGPNEDSNIDDSKIKLVIMYRYGVPEEHYNKIVVNDLKDNALFNKDFSLELHDPDSIKLPYIPRVKATEGSSNINGTVYTRFINNALSNSLKSNNKVASQMQKYFEYTYDMSIIHI